MGQAVKSWGEAERPEPEPVRFLGSWAQKRLWAGLHWAKIMAQGLCPCPISLLGCYCRLLKAQESVEVCQVSFFPRDLLSLAPPLGQVAVM